jgi:hypothetical protein
MIAMGSAVLCNMAVILAPEYAELFPNEGQVVRNIILMTAFLVVYLGPQMLSELICLEIVH